MTFLGIITNDSLFLLPQSNPRPDWKGREAVAVGEDPERSLRADPRQWRRKPEPWKAGKISKLRGHKVPRTVKYGLRSKKEKIIQMLLRIHLLSGLIYKKML